MGRDGRQIYIEREKESDSTGDSTGDSGDDSGDDIVVMVKLLTRA